MLSLLSATGFPLVLITPTLSLFSSSPLLCSSSFLGSQPHLAVSVNRSISMASPSKPPPESRNQGSSAALQNLPLLGLRLNKTCPYVYEARSIPVQKSKPFCPPAQVSNPQAELEHKEKLKATHIPATLIRIGSWQFASVHKADLVGKFYFASRKLVWEVLENGLKNKMEIQWSDISAIRAIIAENKPGILEVELHQPPTFYKEIDPQPRHHSIWVSTDDFTDGEALNCRRHYLEFPPAAIDKSYVQLLNSDRRLLELSQSGFPSSAETSFCMLQQFNGDEHPPRGAIATPQAHQVLQSAYTPALTPQRRRSSEAAIRQALLCRDSTPPMSDSRLLENYRLENLQLTPWGQVSHNFSHFEALPPPSPAAAARPALCPGEVLYSPYVGETGFHTLQSPAVMRNTQRRLFSDPISSYNLMLPPAIHGAFTSLIGPPSPIGSASNGDAMGAGQEHNGYANSSREFIIGPPEQNGTFTSLLGMPSTIGSAGNGVAMGVKPEHEGFVNSGGQFIICSKEQYGSFTSQIGSACTTGSANIGNVMDGFSNSNGQLMFGPSEQNGTFPSPIGSLAAGSSSHGEAMGVGQQYNGYAGSDGQFEFGAPVSEEQIYEQLEALMRHQAQERKLHGGSPWKCSNSDSQ